MTVESNAELERAGTIPTTCPRCGHERGAAEFYGPCATCTTTLRSMFDGTPREDVAAAEYEPKMNVTPNAVASKD